MSSFETSPDAELVVRVRGQTFVAPRVELPRACFVLRVSAPFGVADIDDLVEVQMRVAEDVSNEDLADMAVVAETKHGLFALVRSSIRDYEPRTTAPGGGFFIRLSSAHRAAWTLVTRLDDRRVHNCTNRALNICEYAGRTPHEQRLAALDVVYSSAAVHLRPKTALSAALSVLTAPAPRLEVEVKNLTAAMDVETMRHFMTWHEFYTRDATGLLMHVLERGGFRASPVLATLLEQAAQEVRETLLRHHLSAPKEGANSSP